MRGRRPRQPADREGLPHAPDGCVYRVEQVSDLLVPEVSDFRAGPEAPTTGRPGGLPHARRGRWKVAKRLGVRQSPAAFPRRRVEKVLSG